MALYTKCILAPREVADGLRVSVMSRHTHDDGITPDERICDYDKHLPELGPSPVLIGSYLKRNLSWEAFAKRYLAEMRRPLAHRCVVSLAATALVSDVTLLCIERGVTYCHRGLLAELCQREFPRLTIIHR